MLAQVAAIVVAGVVGVLGLAGCRDDTSAKRLDKREYLRQARAIEASSAASRATRLFFQIVVEPPLPRQPCHARTREFHRLLVTIVDRVERLRAPAEVAGLQRELVAAARTSIRAVKRAANDVRAANLRCGRPLNLRIYDLPSTRRVNALLRAYAKRGYVIGLNSD